MAYLVTGAAGFIGFHTCRKLLDRGESVVGVDVVNDYYDPALKEARLAILYEYPRFPLHRADIADRAAMEKIAAWHPDVTRIIHLAAQAGVRYSLVNPYSYTRSNIEGQLVMLEIARHCRAANTSSMRVPLPSTAPMRSCRFPWRTGSINPISLYAATKKAGELMAHCYSHLYKIPSTGLRFFTVYGPWGRPDMAAFLFVKAILAGQPITVFNHGDMRRDFTFVDDIVQGVWRLPTNNQPAPEFPRQSITSETIAPSR